MNWAEPGFLLRATSMCYYSHPRSLWCTRGQGRRRSQRYWRKGGFRQLNQLRCSLRQNNNIEGERLCMWPTAPHTAAASRAVRTAELHRPQRSSCSGHGHVSLRDGSCPQHVKTSVSLRVATCQHTQIIIYRFRSVPRFVCIITELQLLGTKEPTRLNSWRMCSPPSQLWSEVSLNGILRRTLE
jgi:hypothetical protein